MALCTIVSPKMRFFTRFLSLSWTERTLLLEAVLWLGLARAAVLTFPFRWIMQGLGQSANVAHTANSAPLQPVVPQVTWAIRVVSRRTPWQSNCLAQALAGLIMLRRRGIVSTLYLGVLKDKQSQLAAHAWLRSSEMTVTGGNQLDQYTVVAWFSR